MKSLLLFFAFFLLHSVSFSIAIICHTTNPVCFEITRLSSDGGLTWRNACCNEIVLAPGQTCTDDCFPTKPVYRYIGVAIEGMSDQYTKSQEIDNGIRINTFYKLDLNKLWVDGVIVCEFSDHINAVLFTLQTGEVVELKQEMVQEKKELYSIIKLNIPAIEKDIMKSAITISPNPVNFSKESLLLQSSIEILNVELIDMYGRVHLLDNENWKGSKSVQISVNPGIYILRMKAINTQTYFDQRIVVVN